MNIPDELPLGLARLFVRVGKDRKALGAAIGLLEELKSLALEIGIVEGDTDSHKAVLVRHAPMRTGEGEGSEGSEEKEEEEGAKGKNR
jgi:hypothetical protein